MNPPTFRYHPDPLATGSIKNSDVQCVCCEQRRGFIYVGPVYSEEEHVEDICPWCIADGTAHQRLGAEFVDIAGVGDRGSWEQVPKAIAEEVAYRTPGFAGWQQERWFTCCGDAAAFLGRAGRKELNLLGPEAVEAIRLEIGYSGKYWEEYFAGMDRDGQPTAYVFRCLHCKRIGGYSDFT